MLIHACVLAGCLVGAEPAPVSLDESRARLTAELADHVYLALGLGDARRAARAFAVLAAVADNGDLLTDIAFRLLDACGDAGLPRDTRAGLISHDAAVREKTLRLMLDAVRSSDAEHRIPADLRGRKVLGPADGCPIEKARAFAAGPSGSLLALSDRLAAFDGAHWRVIPELALRVYPPIGTVFVDRKGRTWLATAARSDRAGPLDRPSRQPPAEADMAARITGLMLDELERYSRGTFGYFESAPDGVPVRWHVFGEAEGITSIAESKTALWLASQSRLFIFDGDAARPVPCPLPYSPRRSVLAGPESDEVWLVDVDRVSRFDGRRWSSFRPQNARPVAGAMLKNAPVILLDNGLLFVSGEKFEVIDAPKDTAELAAIAIGPDGRVWCVSAAGDILILNAARSEWSLWKSSVRTLRGRPAIFCDAAGRVWLSREQGLEVCAGEPDGAPASLFPVTRRPQAHALAPLLSAAGSAGWTEDGVPLDIEEQAKDEKGPKATPPDNLEDLGGFAEDDAKIGNTPKEALDELRKNPGAAGLFSRLMRMLSKEPDASVRKEALTLAVKGLNQSFYANPAYVRECAESTLDADRPLEAYLILLEAWCRTADDEYRAVLEPTVYEALVSMGFGEFARPAFLRSDLVPAIRQTTALAHLPSGARAVAVGLSFDVVTEQERAAKEVLPKAMKGEGLEAARILVLKRRVLAAPGDGEAWKALVSECVEQGEDPTMARYRRYTALAQLATGAAYGGIVANDKKQAADSSAWSPYRWIRRVDLAMDGGLGPVIDGEMLYVLDEGANRLTAVRLADGKPAGTVEFADTAVRAVLNSDKGLIVVVQQKDGSCAARAVTATTAAAPVPLTGLTDAFDGFSSTPARGGVFYCFDEGLTKVDLGAGKVAWRNAEVAGGMNFWRSLIERSLPVADGADVFVHAGYRAFCVAADTGEIRWARDAGAPCTPVVVGDVLVVQAPRREVWGLDRKTGEPRWKHIGPGEVAGSFASDGERVFYATRDGDVAALDAKTGDFLWRRPTDIALTRPESPRPKPTALLARAGRLAACNKFAYVEFDTKTGAILRRLELTTGRPMAAGQGVTVVATDPARFVAVADPPQDGPAAGMLASAEKAWADAKKKAAIGVLRLVAGYVAPQNVRAHALGLDWSAAEEPAQAEAFYASLLSNADLLAPDVRGLLRGRVACAPKTGPFAVRAFELFALAHMERGDQREGARALERLDRGEQDAPVSGARIRLEASGGDRPAALRTAQALAATDPHGAAVAVAALIAAGMEEAALDLAAPRTGRREGIPLLLAAVRVSGRSGLFEKAREMLDRSAGIVPRHVRGLYMAYLLSSAGVADRVLKKDGEELRKKVEQHRALLVQRREALKDLNQPAELKAVTEELDRLEKQPLP